MKTPAKLIANFGDVHWLEYGGFFLFKTKYGFQIEMFDSENDPPNAIVVYRFNCDQWYMKAQENSAGIMEAEIVSIPNGNPAVHHPWFDLAAVAETHNEDRAELMNDLCSDDPVKRAGVYQCIAGHYGAINLDQYPLVMTLSELRKRYRSVLRAEKRLKL